MVFLDNDSPWDILHFPHEVMKNKLVLEYL